MSGLQGWFLEGERAGLSFEVMVRDAFVGGWSGGVIVRELKLFGKSGSEILGILKGAGFSDVERRGFYDELRVGRKGLSGRQKTFLVLGGLCVVLALLLVVGFSFADHFDCEKGLVDGYRSLDELNYCQGKLANDEDVVVSSNLSHTVVVVRNDFIAKWLKEVVM